MQKPLLHFSPYLSTTSPAKRDCVYNLKGNSTDEPQLRLSLDFHHRPDSKATALLDTEVSLYPLLVIALCGELSHSRKISVIACRLIALQQR